LRTLVGPHVGNAVQWVFLRFGATCQKNHTSTSESAESDHNDIGTLLKLERGFDSRRRAKRNGDKWRPCRDTVRAASVSTSYEDHSVDEWSS
jgi:hypothetical protein